MLAIVKLFYFVICEDPAGIEFFWDNIWLEAWSYMTSYYTRGYVTTLHDFEGALGWSLDNFFWALTISQSRLLARVWSGHEPNVVNVYYSNQSLACRSQLHDEHVKTKISSFQQILKRFNGRLEVDFMKLRHLGKVFIYIIGWGDGCGALDWDIYTYPKLENIHVGIWFFKYGVHMSLLEAVKVHWMDDQCPSPTC
jgi:hypothetical protein